MIPETVLTRRLKRAGSASPFYSAEHALPKMRPEQAMRTATGADYVDGLLMM